MTSAPAPRKRMRAEDRRSQLLDAAATVVEQHGASAMTMERLADQAGVSKALPYKHFDNSEEVLVELYRREMSGLGRAVWRALRDAPTGMNLVGVGVGTYFDEIVARGAVLAALSQPGSMIASSADPEQAGVAFEVQILHRFHGVERERAKQIAGIVQGAIAGASGAFRAGRATREQLETDLVAVIQGLIDA